MTPLILHVDMDAFFASVEVRSDPRLAGKPVAVGGGPGGRGVVTAASYPARKFGVSAGMPLARARALCPSLLVLPVNPGKVVYESMQVLRVLQSLCPRVEAASIDEAYLEYPPAPADRWEPLAREWAHRVHAAVCGERGLTCSVGAAGNKLQAKMAGALGKPDGVTVVPPPRFLATFAEHPVGAIPGVGPRSVQQLNERHIFTVGDLARDAPSRKRWGAVGAAAGEPPEIRVCATGEDPAPKSVGHETTFARDVDDPAVLRSTLWWLSDRVARRLRLGRLSAGGVAVRFKLGARRHSRQRRIRPSTQDPLVLARLAWSLLEPAREGRRLRLVGVAALYVVPCVHPPEGDALFPPERQRRAVLEVGDRLRDRFGEHALTPAAGARRRNRR